MALTLNDFQNNPYTKSLADSVLSGTMPSWTDVRNASENGYRANVDPAGFNRIWSTDPQMMAQKSAIDSSYSDLAAAFNAQHPGSAIDPAKYQGGIPDANSANSAYQVSMPADHKGSSGFFSGGLGMALVIGAGIALGGSLFMGAGALSEAGAGAVIGDLSGMGASEFVTADMVTEAMASGTLTAEEGAAAMSAIGGDAAAAGAAGAAAGAVGGAVADGVAGAAASALPAGESAVLAGESSTLAGEGAGTIANTGTNLAAEQTANLGANAPESALQHSAQNILNSGVPTSGAPPLAPDYIAQGVEGVGTPGSSVANGLGAPSASPGYGGNLLNQPPTGLIDKALKWAKDNPQLASAAVQGVGSVVGGAAKGVLDNQTMKTKAQLDLENKQKLIAYYRDFVQGGSAGGVGVNMGGAAPSSTPALTRPGGGLVYNASGRLN